MQVQVKLFATLRRDYPELGIGETLAVELEPGGTVQGLIGQLALPDGLVKIVFVNNVIRPETHVLEDGDVVAIFPPVGGG